MSAIKNEAELIAITLQSPEDIMDLLFYIDRDDLLFLREETDDYIYLYWEHEGEPSLFFSNYEYGGYGTSKEWYLREAWSLCINDYVVCAFEKILRRLEEYDRLHCSSNCYGP